MFIYLKNNCACFAASNVEILVSGNERCYSVINRVMQAFPHHQPLQEVGCCLFQKFIALGVRTVGSCCFHFMRKLILEHYC